MQKYCCIAILNDTGYIALSQVLFNIHVKGLTILYVSPRYFFYYNPHFNCAPQLVHVLHPPISATWPFLHTGHVSPTSEPIVTFVFSNTWFISTTMTHCSDS